MPTYHAIIINSRAHRRREVSFCISTLKIYYVKFTIPQFETCGVKIEDVTNAGKKKNRAPFCEIPLSDVDLAEARSDVICAEAKNSLFTFSSPILLCGKNIHKV